ncbi:hypothetical protein A3H65_02840 [Candidatus Giovannonibacteria bacterium RIFCSPLOWO2_02_FULL_45_14]|uniref:Bacitracin transporter permease BcrC n=3 Tax=Parcubacteria group TaxID=1794811 RepID=A0A0H4TF43_9BACT|nr:bacitracin transporter permease BcrC [uncultured Parcubacteria bacterium Rifle_16ft_4_minimus_37658]AKQ05650.1 bacitracin transporter permease BcrC [uncultured Parcubacteria bacterium Rifle_16ft_4_minimus_23641]OGF69952.1 MAG: hypothetical protein A3C75_01255 [Candidatus Giovannonibacteria bacterium RIFCSPHIGHO2_02_FULL_44_31]OGF76991.1 MAG: hypothetical protein A3E62_01495 [Candidatus Giovannonibacteria bacterium RIFCSPHIGHO2_12_FULL_44_29]OGF90492.1 MAG: hypothetical protein A3H65_02840 [C
MIYSNLVIFFGNYLAWILGAGLVFFVISQNRENFRVAIEALFAGILSRFVFAEIIRYFYDKPRPFEVDVSIPLILHEVGKSFPSGHAAFFFAVATTLFIYNRRWGIVFFIGAIAMGIGRVLAHIHWPIDILGGALIGIASAAIIWKVMHKRGLTRKSEIA